MSDRAADLGTERALGAGDPLEKFKALPRSLQSQAEVLRLGDDVPALVITPEGEGPFPLVIWMHGRTVFKELDPGRYLRWMRAGIGACAIDLPGHGERFERDLTHPRSSPEVIARASAEIDGVVDALFEGSLAGRFRRDAVGIGGMSLGGMVTLRRLCEPHTFKAAAIESSTGDLAKLWSGEDFDEGGWVVEHPTDVAEAVDPMHHLDGFAPIPLLALHSESDEIIPWKTQQRFLGRLGEHYEARGSDRSRIEIQTWPQTGAPQEHNGFGKVSNDAKNTQTAFFERTLG